MVIPAAELESQTLEFKGWGKDERELIRKVEQDVVCLANSEGGLLILGINDKAVGRAAFERCSFGPVTVQWVKARIQQFTKPPVQCNVAKAGDLVTDLACPGSGDVIVIEVPKTSHPGRHRTSGGVCYVRADKECKIEHPEGDFTKLPLEHLDQSQLDWHAIEEAVARREIQYPIKMGLQPIDHLVETELLHLGTHTGERGEPTYIPSVAALVLFGTAKALRTELPAAEIVLVAEAAVGKSLNESKHLNLVAGFDWAMRRIRQHISSTSPDFPDDALRELLMNAFLHRSYTTSGPIHIQIRPDQIEIQNPGGLLGSLTAEALLYSPSIYRNPLLADAVRQFGYCDKAGNGINKVYNSCIVNGFDFPSLNAEHDCFSAIIRTTPDRAFASFIRDFAGTLTLNLTELIVLRVLRTRGKATVDRLSKFAQRPIDITEGVVEGLVRRNIIVPQDDGYLLSPVAQDQLKRYDDGGQLKLFSNK